MSHSLSPGKKAWETRRKRGFYRHKRRKPFMTSAMEQPHETKPRKAVAFFTDEEKRVRPITPTKDVEAEAYQRGKIETEKALASGKSKEEIEKQLDNALLQLQGYSMFSTKGGFGGAPDYDRVQAGIRALERLKADLETEKVEPSRFSKKEEKPTTIEKVQCECGNWFSPTEIVSHTLKCSAFHRRWGSKIVDAHYSKVAKVPADEQIIEAVTSENKPYVARSKILSQFHEYDTVATTNRIDELVKVGKLDEMAEGKQKSYLGLPHQPFPSTLPKEVAKAPKKFGDEAVCTYVATRSGEIFDIYPTTSGGYWSRQRNYEGLYRSGATASLDDMQLKALQDAEERGIIRIVHGKLPRDAR